jgi:hypothetical protein
VPLTTLNRLAAEAHLALPDGRPLSFVEAPAAGLTAREYERRIAERAEIPTRVGSAHDRCNALAWLAFPRTKAALNTIHVAAPDAVSANRRSRARDAATLLDESGAIAACTDPGVIALWQAHAWRALFWERRATVAATLAVEVIGHGLLAKLAAPYRALTAKALMVAVDARSLPAAPRERAARLDAAAAARIAGLGAAFVPAMLLSLPLAAVPGWDTEARGAELFDDVAVFRPRPVRERGG